jgi:hypothetical protein
MKDRRKEGHTRVSGVSSVRQMRRETISGGGGLNLGW